MPIPSKQQQWEQAIANARDAIQNLIDIQEECQDKYNAMSEKSQESEKGDALSKVCDLDFDIVIEELDNAGDCEIPA